MTQVKICGLTRPEDVRLACDLGASFVGFVFAAGSARQVSLAGARALAEAVSPGVARVGVFVDEDYSLICDAVRQARLDLAQIHRSLREEDLSRIPIPIVAVARLGETAEALPDQELLGQCRAMLFDTASEELPGGTGRRFNWGLVEGGGDLRVPVFLAGGLDPDNVGEAIRRVRPAAVDVSTGVEERPGVKDPAKLASFFEAVRQADALTS
jgi:phosphoribosylanthranilate isomerase